MANLTAKQSEVVALMRAGWTLRQYLPTGRVSVVKGDESRMLSRATLTALLKQGVVVERRRVHPTATFGLVNG